MTNGFHNTFAPRMAWINGSGAVPSVIL